MDAESTTSDSTPSATPPAGADLAEPATPPPAGAAVGSATVPNPAAQIAQPPAAAVVGTPTPLQSTLPAVGADERSSTEPECPAPPWQMGSTIALSLLALAVLFVGVAPANLSLGGRWLISIVLVTLFIIFAGRGVTGLSRGFLIDERNRMSLSRFQFALWTILFLSAWLVVALDRIRNNVPDPLGITVPQELLLVLGISTTSLVGSPALLSTKTSTSGNKSQTQTPQADSEMALLRAKVRDKRIRGKNDKTCRVENNGQLIKMSCPECASVADLFTGEETTNGAHLDLARVQMFYFTLVLVLAYAVLIWNQLNSGSFNSFPPFDPGMVTLLGISHAGYLTNKVVPH